MPDDFGLGEGIPMYALKFKPGYPQWAFVRRGEAPWVVARRVDVTTGLVVCRKFGRKSWQTFALDFFEREIRQLV